MQARLCRDGAQWQCRHGVAEKAGRAGRSQRGVGYPVDAAALTASTSWPRRALASSTATLPLLPLGSLSQRFSKCKMSATEGASRPACNLCTEWVQGLLAGSGCTGFGGCTRLDMGVARSGGGLPRADADSLPPQPTTPVPAARCCPSHRFPASTAPHLKLADGLRCCLQQQLRLVVGHLGLGLRTRLAGPTKALPESAVLGDRQHSLQGGGLGRPLSFLNQATAGPAASARKCVSLAGPHPRSLHIRQATVGPWSRCQPAAIPTAAPPRPQASHNLGAS